MRSTEFRLRDDEPRLDHEPPGVVQVRPVVRTLTSRSVPRVVEVALVVGTIAFVAGLRLGAVRPTDASRHAISPPASASRTANAVPVTGPPYTSEFAETFRPPDLFAAFVGGKGCVSHNEQKVEAIGIVEYVLARTWTTFCPLDSSTRASFVSDLTDAIGQTMPGSQWSADTQADGTTLVLFPYTEGGFVGTVTLSAAAEGSGFEVVILLQERRSP